MFFNDGLYAEDLRNAIEGSISFEAVNGTKVLITGASGLIGSFLVDAFMYYSEITGCSIDVFAMGRNKNSLTKRFRSHGQKPNFHTVEHDVSRPLTHQHRFDYIIHAASNAFPQAFWTDPVGTVMCNVLGVYNLLEYARHNGLRRFLFVSSGEVYGQGCRGVAAFEESYNGYIDITTPRACYPIGKTAGETLCTSYTAQYGLDTVIARPCHTYGPTATKRDNRVSAQFINSVMAGEDIVLKSQGSQLRSYCYVADSASGLLTILMKGETGKAYNIANPTSIVTIREMAEMLADISGRRVGYDASEESEDAGYSPVTQSVLSAKRLEALGWKGKYGMNTGLQRTIKILSNVTRNEE